MPWSIIVFPVEMAIPMNLGIQLFGSFWMMQVRPPNPKPIRPLRLLLFTAETFGLKWLKQAAWDTDSCKHPSLGNLVSTSSGFIPFPCRWYIAGVLIQYFFRGLPFKSSKWRSWNIRNISISLQYGCLFLSICPLLVPFWRFTGIVVVYPKSIPLGHSTQEFGGSSADFSIPGSPKPPAVDVCWIRCAHGKQPVIGNSRQQSAMFQNSLSPWQQCTCHQNCMTCFNSVDHSTQAS